MIDPECDPVINGEADVFTKRLANDERQRALDEDKRELTNMRLAIRNIDVVFGLVQLGLLVYDDCPPPISILTQPIRSKRRSQEMTHSKSRFPL